MPGEKVTDEEMNAPKFEKKIHHIVPQGWQRRFFSRGADGAIGRTGYYMDVRKGLIVGPIGPGEKMSEEWANIVFDEHFNPSDAVEDWCSHLEDYSLTLIDRIAASRAIAVAQRLDVARWLALQSLRYPNLYQPRLDLGRCYAIAVGEAHRFSNLHAFNEYLAMQDVPSNCYPTEAEFAHIRDLPAEIRQRTIDEVLVGHGYEWFLNVRDVLIGAAPLGNGLASFGWDLLEANGPWFILSDRPVPDRFTAPFATALTYDVAVRIVPAVSAPPADLRARTATVQEIVQINAEVRSRAQQWICGPDPFLQAS
jgi:hypothetical protein